ncbi:MAG: hypothetical protein KIT34_18605 [Cyanobacteria bacterium TGS_CYA1]|nr:hypothetical protein [Cyanobacteria bacterium TGS_CYA1]
MNANDESQSLNEAMNRFKTASTYLRTEIFSKASDHQEYEYNIWEGFEDVERLLFQRLVTIPCNLENISYGSKIQQSIRVRPLSWKDLAILNNGSQKDYESFSSDEVELGFVGYFYRIHNGEEICNVEFEVCSSTMHPEAVGGRGFIEAKFVSFECS